MLNVVSTIATSGLMNRIRVTLLWKRAFLNTPLWSFSNLASAALVPLWSSAPEE